MADDTGAAAATAGGDTGAAAAAAVIDKTILGGGDTDGDTAGAGDAGDTGAAATAPTLGENWREALAGGDDAFLKQLKRFASPDTFAKSYQAAQAKLRSGPALPTLAEGATAEEVAAYRKQVGIPEKPEGYGFSFPQEIGATEADAEALGDFQSFMHERNVPPGAAKAAFDYYVKRMGEGRTAAAEAAEAATLENMAELRAEFKGREFTRNTKIAGDFLDQHFGDPEFGGDPAYLKALHEVLALQLPSGVKVGSYAPFVKGLVAMARVYADDEAVLGGDGAGGGKSIEEEYRALIKESTSDPRAWDRAPEKQKRLDELAAAKTRQSERASRQAA